MIDTTKLRPPLLRRCDVVNADFRVVMRGPSADQLAPFFSGETLEVEFGREVASVIALHDFGRRPVGTALVGSEYGLRIAVLPGLRSDHYCIQIERLSLGSRLRSTAALYRLDAGEQELLRLLAGGYDEREIAQRLDESSAQLRSRARSLSGKLGCTRRSDLVALVFGTASTEHTDVQHGVGA